MIVEHEEKEENILSDEKAPEFGQYLKELRIAKGLTLIELGKLIDLSNPYLSQIENGKRGIPAPDLLEKLAIALDVPFIELLDKTWRIKNNKSLIPDPELFSYDLANLLYHGKINFRGHILTKKERDQIEGILHALFPEEKPPKKDSLENECNQKSSK
jgi:transcriptional regulator with XRE-family HTH domain